MVGLIHARLLAKELGKRIDRHCSSALSRGSLFPSLVLTRRR